MHKKPKIRFEIMQVDEAENAEILVFMQILCCCMHNKRKNMQKLSRVKMKRIFGSVHKEKQGGNH